MSNAENQTVIEVGPTEIRSADIATKALSAIVALIDENKFTPSKETLAEISSRLADAATFCASANTEHDDDELATSIAEQLFEETFCSAPEAN